MDEQEAIQRVENMKNIILKEAESSAEEIKEEGHQEANDRKNQIFQQLREGLASEYKKKELRRKVEVDTMRSRRIN